MHALLGHEERWAPAKAGADYGWNVREGHCAVNSATNCGPPPAGMTNPVFDYPRSTGCAAITGGAFVPRGLWPAAYNDRYLFGDYVCGKIRSLELVPFGGSAVDFGTDMGAVIDLSFGPWESTQALYYLVWTAGQGEVRRIAYTGNRSPVAVARATPTSGGTPLTVSFDGSASRDPDPGGVLYNWDFGDGSADATSAKVNHTYAQAGTYQATLRVMDIAGETATQTVRIDAGNTAPLATIQAPTTDTRFRVGETITLRGTAGDLQDGGLAPSSLSWTVLLRHNTHTHPFLGPASGNNIQFQAPPPEDLTAAASSYLEVRLTATDSKGLTHTVSQDLRPRTVALFFKPEPAGLKLIVDGITTTEPVGFVSWEGYRFTVEAPGAQGLAGQLWTFGSWSDGGSARHTITGTDSALYTASYNAAQCGGGLGVGMLLVMVGSAVARRVRRHR